MVEGIVVNLTFVMLAYGAALLGRKR